MPSSWSLPCPPVVGALVALLASGCGEVTLIDPGPELSHPPHPPESGAPGDGPGAVLAITRVRLGRNAPDGALDAGAWEGIGYDLDGVDTRDPPGATCAPAEGVTFFAALQDGRAGRDNAFGKNILPMIQVLAKSAEERTNDDLAEGRYTTLLVIDELGSTSEYDGLSARVYDGAPLGSGAPELDGGDVWPPTFESAQEDQATGSVAPILDSYVTGDGDGGTWVGHSPGVVVVQVAMSPEVDLDKVVHLRVHRPVIAVHFSLDRATGTGILAGFLWPGEVHTEVRRVMGLYVPEACLGEELDGVKHQIDAAADILGDGSVDPGAPCDSISFGLAFEAFRVTLGPAAPPAPPPEDVCP